MVQVVEGLRIGYFVDEVVVDIKYLLIFFNSFDNVVVLDFIK